MKRFITGGASLRAAPDRLGTAERRKTGAGRVRRRWAGAVAQGGRSRVMVLLAGLSVPAVALLLAAGPAQEPVVELAAVEVSRTGESVMSAWSERFGERERERAVGDFALEFSIPEELAGQIYAAAERHEIEPEIAFGLVRTESSFRRTVVSHAGAVGYTQLLPSTARWIAPGTTRAALFNTETNLDVGLRYLRFLKDKYDGNVDLALTAYNRGQGRVDRLLRSGRNPDNGYATAVRTGHVSRTLIRQNSPRSGR